MAHECPACREHRARSEFGSEGWLHPSGFYRGLLICNACGRYYEETPNMLVPVENPDVHVRVTRFASAG